MSYLCPVGIDYPLTFDRIRHRGLTHRKLRKALEDSRHTVQPLSPFFHSKLIGSHVSRCLIINFLGGRRETASGIFIGYGGQSPGLVKLVMRLRDVVAPESLLPYRGPHGIRAAAVEWQQLHVLLSRLTAGSAPLGGILEIVELHVAQSDLRYK